MPHPTLPHVEPSSVARPTLWALCGGALALGAVFVGFFDEYALGISAPIFVLLTIGLLGLASARTGGARLRQHPWLVGGSVFFATMLFVRSNEVLTFVNVVLTLVFGLALTQAVAEREPRTWAGKKFLLCCILPLRFLERFFVTAGTLADRHGTTVNSGTGRQILKGTAIAIPVLLVFVGLFASADRVFRQGLEDIFDSLSLPDMLPKALLWVVASAVLVGMSAYVATYRGEGPHEFVTATARRWGTVVTGIVLGATNLLFLVFIAIQARFLFGGEAAIAEYGITYSRYAREGFFQLIWVAVIAFALLWWAERRTTLRSETTHGTAFIVLATLLTMQTIAVMGSAFYRLSLYVEAYGLTPLRFYSQTFVVWLLVPFLLLLWHRVYERRASTHFAARLAMSLALFVAALNLANPDRIIASTNINREDVKKLDTDQLRELSYDATPALVTALALPLETYQRANIEHALKEDLSNLKSHHRLQGWPSWNLGRHRASKALAPIESTIVLSGSAAPTGENAAQVVPAPQVPLATYTNTAFGYSLSYPAESIHLTEAVFANAATPTSTTVHVLENAQGYTNNRISISIFAGKTAKEAAFSRVMGSGMTLRQTTFAGQPAMELSGNGVRRLYILERNDKTLFVEQVAPTFRLDEVMESFTLTK
jgi:hypothetical protein